MESSDFQIKYKYKKVKYILTLNGYENATLLLSLEFFI